MAVDCFATIAHLPITDATSRTINRAHQWSVYRDAAGNLDLAQLKYSSDRCPIRSLHRDTIKLAQFPLSIEWCIKQSNRGTDQYLV